MTSNETETVMTDATAINPHGKVYLQRWTWLIWIAIVVAGTVWVCQSVIATVQDGQDGESVTDVQPVPNSMDQWGQSRWTIHGVDRDHDHQIKSDEDIIVSITVLKTKLVEVRTPPEWFHETRQMLRMGGGIAFAATAILCGLAFAIYRRWNLSKWVFADYLRMSLLGGFFVYGALWMQVEHRRPEHVALHWSIVPAFVIVTYALIVVTLAAIREWLHGRQGVWAKVARGTLATIAILAGLVFLALFSLAVLIKFLVIFK